MSYIITILAGVKVKFDASVPDREGETIEEIIQYYEDKAKQAFSFKPEGLGDDEIIIGIEVASLTPEDKLINLVSLFELEHKIPKDFEDLIGEVENIGERGLWLIHKG